MYARENAAYIQGNMPGNKPKAPSAKMVNLDTFRPSRAVRPPTLRSKAGEQVVEVGA